MTLKQKKLLVHMKLIHLHRTVLNETDPLDFKAGRFHLERIMKIFVSFIWIGLDQVDQFPPYIFD